MPDRGSHLSERCISLYVMGLMEPAEIEQVEAHVDDCPPCLTRLEQEARFETLLLQAQEPSIPQPPPAPARAERWGRAACGVLATAASVLLMLSDPARFVEIGLVGESSAPSQNVSAELDDDATCIPTEDPICDDEPLTLALATYPPEAPDAFEGGGSCWLDDRGIDPLCVSSDPLSG